MIKHMIDHRDIFSCPVCRSDLEIVNEQIKCVTCDKEYLIENDIPLLYCPNEWDNSKKDVSKEIQSFYEKNPFPNYEELESVDDLIQKAQRGVFARLLNQQVPYNIRVLEVGCGTGQLSNFLSIAHRFVFATDLCLNSLKLGQAFKHKNGLDRVGFYQMNLFKPTFKEGSFHLVICNGVLHHTSDPLAGFQSISRLVKKGGYIFIGLYNRYGRIPTDIRRYIFKSVNDRFKFLDPRLRDNHIGYLKKQAWFMDQYKNPHESKHTIGEVLRWFDNVGFEFINSIPKLTAFTPMVENENLFKSNLRGSWLDHFFVQTVLPFTESIDGGFFIMIGRKKM